MHVSYVRVKGQGHTPPQPHPLYLRYVTLCAVLGHVTSRYFTLCYFVLSQFMLYYRKLTYFKAKRY